MLEIVYFGFVWVVYETFLPSCLLEEVPLWAGTRKNRLQQSGQKFGGCAVSILCCWMVPGVSWMRLPTVEKRGWSWIRKVVERNLTTLRLCWVFHMFGRRQKREAVSLGAEPKPVWVWAVSVPPAPYDITGGRFPGKKSVWGDFGNRIILNTEKVKLYEVKIY